MPDGLRGDWRRALVPGLAMQAGTGQGQLCQLRHEIWKSELDRRSRELGLFDSEGRCGETSSLEGVAAHAVAARGRHSPPKPTFEVEKRCLVPTRSSHPE